MTSLRRLRASVAVAIAIGSVLPACTFLADFVDDPCVGGACFDASLDVATIDVVVADARPDVKDGGPPPVDAAGACKGKSNGWYCGNNGLSAPVPKEYLVECRDGGAILTYCTNDCLGFPSGTPDRCDPCRNDAGAPLANGKYCGQSFWPGTENAPYLFSCGGGSAIIQTKCVNGCTTSLGNAACK